MKPILNKILLTLVTICSLFCIAAAQAEEPLPLPGDKAFVFTAILENSKNLVLEWHIAPGYYLYRDKLHIKFLPAHSAVLGSIHWPASKDQRDPIRGTFRAYEGVTRLVLPLKGRMHEAVTLAIQYQGCSHDGFCYAPMIRQLHLSYPFTGEGLNNSPMLTVTEAPAPEMEKTAVSASSLEEALLTDQSATQAFLGGHTFFLSLLCFLGLGLLLAFTPCSLPMIPILSSIIIGQDKRMPGRSFKLSLAYVLGMALTYACAGIAIAWVGSSIQTYFQNPWIITAFSFLFIVLAFSMLGMFELRMPRVWQQMTARWSQGQKGGSYLGVFLMGCLSTLIVSPCLTAPLVGVLAYVSDTGNLILGGSALFALGLGMGLPLLLIGFSAGKYLPKAGPWMEMIKKLFGFMLLGMAIWMLSRVLPGGFTMFLGGCLFISLAVFLFFIEAQTSAWRTTSIISGILFALYAFVLFVGVAIENDHPFYLYAKLVQKQAAQIAATNPKPDSVFTTVKNMAQLNTILKKAKQAKQPVIVDFFAEWCESCQALETAVLGQTEVQNKLKQFVLVRANVTENNAFDQAMLKRYHVIAPPTFLFINRDGQEVTANRIVGEVDHKQFLARAGTV